MFQGKSMMTIQQKPQSKKTQPHIIAFLMKHKKTISKTEMVFYEY